MTGNYKHLFGPVPSRRLGRSLGVDLTPHKICSFDCSFCQLGRTTNKTVVRSEYVPTSEVIDELRDWIGHDGKADFITLAGSGEPTLHSRFGEVIDFVKSATTIPVALLTNGSTLLDEEVLQAAARAKVVKVSLSAGDQFTFEHVNRPHPDVTLNSIVEGGRMLRERFSGELWVEVFIVWGVNSFPTDVSKIAELVKTLRPDRVQLNTAVRPAAEEFVVAAPRAHLETLVDLFEPRAEVIAEFNATHAPDVQINEASILSMLERRPCTAKQISGTFNMHENEVSKYLGKLIQTGQIHAEHRQGDVYYIPKKRNEKL